MNEMKRFEGETFEEWRTRYNLPRVRAEAKVAAQRAQYDAAEVVPAIAYEPSRDTAALTRLLKDRGGILHEVWGYKGGYTCAVKYFADPAKYEEAKSELAGKVRPNPASEGRRKRFERRLRQLFPGLDDEDVEDILDEQFCPGARVAQSRLPLDTRVKLAVRAFLRHQDGAYESLLARADGSLHCSPEYNELRKEANQAAEETMEALQR